MAAAALCCCWVLMLGLECGWCGFSPWCKSWEDSLKCRVSPSAGTDVSAAVAAPAGTTVVLAALSSLAFSSSSVVLHD